MHKKVTSHFRSLILPLLLVAAIGAYFDELAWTLVFALGAYLAWTLFQTSRLHNWLYSEGDNTTIPESYGLWGDLFEGLYNVQQENQLVRQKLESMVKRVQSSTNALSEALITTDQTGKMDWWNPAAEKLLGFQRETDEGQLIYNLVRDPSFKAYFETKQYHEPIELDSPSNPNMKLRIFMTLFGDDDRLVIAQNVTHVHKLEQMRKDFVGNVSHEMRTPLTVVKGYLETLIDNASDMPSRWQRAFGTMLAQTNRLEVLVSDLLLLAKYETTDHASTQNEMDIVNLVSMIVHDAEILSGDKHHELIWQCDYAGKFLGDEKQIRSAISNIVFNAVKYTPENGVIKVHLWESPVGLHLSVADNGVGFDPIHIPRLTERFYRADPSRDNATGGSGLGLSIVKHVLLNHESDLSIDSEPGLGSEFICNFPKARVVSPKPSEKKTA